ncbi:equistatin-like [Porites lutea]|uniref:equistatin-like n=1 Tax=Porites lutea TaxID=51062 RepID=UPI003CC5F731
MLLLMIISSALAFTNAATKCEQLSSQASQNGGLLGSFVPKCNADGSFSSEQCWPSTGFCWCVDKFGEEIPGTKVRGKADCSKSTATKCEQLSSQASQNGGLLGSFVPKCNTDGSFSSEQCWSSTGFCWCVDKFGEEIPGTKVRGKADCTNKGQ